MTTLLLSCKKCGGPIDPGARAFAATYRRALVDAACPGCGKRALYEVAQGNATGD